MPSIPQSLLWISLVVLWLFVLVPMLINRRDTVRRTSDVALSTRVLNGAARSRLLRRSGPASGHRHDADWEPDDQFVEDYPDVFEEAVSEIREFDDAVRGARMGARTRSVMVVAAVSEQTFVEPDYLDVDIVDENSGALPVGGGVQASLFDTPDQEEQAPEAAGPKAAGPKAADVDADAKAVDVDAEPADVDGGAGPEVEAVPEPVAEPIAERAAEVQAERAPDGTADEYEYIDDTSGLEPEMETAAPTAPREFSRQRRTANTAAVVSARKYRFRKRLLMFMAGLMVLTAVLSFTVSPTQWWSFGAVAGMTVLYLAYLRRQTRIEEQVRRRRQQRMMRSRPLMEDDQFAPREREVDFTEFPTRVQRLGAVVLDIDDEDPIFEHLDEVQYSRRYYGAPDLPRAAGQ